MQLGDGRKELGSGGDAAWPGQQEARGALGVLGEVYELLLGGGGTRRGKLTGSGRNGGRWRCLCGCDASSGVRGGPAPFICGRFFIRKGGTRWRGPGGRGARH